MRETTHIKLVLSFALVFSIPGRPAVSAPPASHETILDRHHSLYGAVIQNPTDAPYGASGDLYGCFSCHAIDSSSGINQFLIERDCQACHHPDLHHILYSSMIPYPTDAPYSASGELYVCLSCHAAHSSAGTNQFPIEGDCQACHHPRDVKSVIVDIRPGSDPNSINLESKGVLPVAILGSKDYDVIEIDASSILLEGEAPPLRWSLQVGAYGYMDLMLKFSNKAVRDALGDLQPGQTYEIWITGTFKDGTYVLGSDSVVAVPPSWGN